MCIRIICFPPNPSCTAVTFCPGAQNCSNILEDYLLELLPEGLLLSVQKMYNFSYMKLSSIVQIFALYSNFLKPTVKS